MGLNIGANVLTSGGLGLTMVLLLVTGILLVSASNKLKQLPEFESSSDLKNANNNLKTAYWLIFIATGISLILGVLYAGHESAWCSSELIHGGLYLLLYIAVIVGLVYSYISLYNIYHPDLENNNGSTAFIWGALLIGAIAFMVMTATGTGRIGMGVTRGSLTHRIRHAEHKLHEAHSAVTGSPNDFGGHYDRCPGECDQQQVLMAPADVAPMPTHSHVSVVTSPATSSVRLPPIPVNQPALVSNQGYQSFVGAPTVTRHSVVTTSQPVVSTSTPQMAATPNRQPISALARSVQDSNAGFI